MARKLKAMAYGALATALACVTVPAFAQGEVDADALEPRTGYLSTGTDDIVTTGTGKCIKTGVWDEDLANRACDPELVVVETAPEPAVTQAEPEPAPEPPPPEPVMRRMVLEGDAHFAFDSAELTQDGEEQLRRFVQQIQDADEILGIRVTGHTDSVGPEAYNQKLSLARAKSVKDYLVDQGLAVSMIRTRGLGESQPVATNETAAGREQNRRAVIEVLMRRQVPQ